MRCKVCGVNEARPRKSDCNECNADHVRRRNYVKRLKDGVLDELIEKTLRNLEDMMTVKNAAKESAS